MSDTRGLSGSRHIWQLDCIGITLVLSHGVPMEKLRMHVRRHLCRRCAKQLEDDARTLQAIHKACHSDNAVSRQIEAFLNTKYARQIAEVRPASCLFIAHRLAHSGLTTAEAVGVIWALLTDTAREKIDLGQRMVHASVLRGALNDKPARPAPTTAESLN